MTSKLVAAVALLSLAGCADTYRGRTPDLKLTEPAQQEREIRNFTMSPGWGGMEMGEGSYTLPSLMPVVESVSPEGARKMDTASTLGLVGQIFILAGLGVAVGAEYLAEGERGQLISLGGLGAGLAGGSIFALLSRGKLDDGLDRYNRDLSARLHGGNGGAAP